MAETSRQTWRHSKSKHYSGAIQGGEVYGAEECRNPTGSARKFIPQQACHAESST